MTSRRTPSPARPTSPPNSQIHLPRETTADDVDNYPWEVRYEDRYPVKDPRLYTEFEKKYPPDLFGEEASDNARVWKMYRDRAKDRDEDVVDGWNRTLDILLIFTGLFSAMATAFIIESYKQLSPDYAEYMAKAFIAINTNDSGAISLPSDFVAPIGALWTNGLWFSSLGLSLLVALLAILAKQWLAEYNSRMRAPTASNRVWVCRHRVYNNGMSKWGLDVFVSALPLGLHVALFLFFLGLVVFLSTINRTLSIVMGVGVGLTAVFYLVVTMLPLWFGDCPTVTPLLRHGHRLARDFVNRTFVVSVAVATDWRVFADDRLDDLPVYDERVLLNGKEPQLHAEALSFIVATAPATEEVTVAAEAVGSLSPEEHRPFLQPDGERSVEYALNLYSACDRRFTALLSAVDAIDAARALRSAILLRVPSASSRLLGNAIQTSSAL